MIIGELARRTGVNTWSLRHYDRAGLLTSTRAQNRYRDFPDRAVREVARIRCLLDAGFNLDEVREILPFIGSEGQLQPSEALRQLVDSRLQSLEGQLAALEKVQRVLRTVSKDLQRRST
ncbi:MerR family transcriptional regulator [Micromonospora polyrhachis]|uniref:DNA-binding transcriptional MerR regulator n=1 Tax=Micromonospora polyrhachis TaxID=1282883 RepID=A0A7W7SMA2_9ACTN|nr:MerR family transcriptional regulator [Micromonospora polyrhachis]MBB4957373.1 DNA-binding transcriptional MerR regulator [Micromonospora polyrhachis]